MAYCGSFALALSPQDMLSCAVVLSDLLVTERPSLIRRLTRLLGSEVAAEDVTQSLFFKLQRVDNPAAIQNKSAFLNRLATNLATDWLRAQKRRDGLFTAIDTAPDVPCDLPIAERQLLDREQLRILLESVDDLTPRCREVFLLRKVEELPVNEIASRLGISRSMVARHMDNALRHLFARVGSVGE
ncbi:RNA polymerase sigma factor [Sphingomonas sp. CCH5-D11]|uniref:RNA polymerase sigma factor n=1 Tax=Sphingomonas sp. CCH5-D11 TaxID=1768786 RepID=UPI000A9C5B33